MCYRWVVDETNHETGSLWIIIDKDNRVSGANDYDNSATNRKWYTGAGKLNFFNNTPKQDKKQYNGNVH